MKKLKILIEMCTTKKVKDWDLGFHGFLCKMDVLPLLVEVALHYFFAIFGPVLSHKYLPFLPCYNPLVHHNVFRPISNVGSSQHPYQEDYNQVNQ